MENRTRLEGIITKSKQKKKDAAIAEGKEVKEEENDEPDETAVAEDDAEVSQSHFLSFFLSHGAVFCFIACFVLLQFLCLQARMCWRLIVSHSLAPKPLSTRLACCVGIVLGRIARRLWSWP